ncbi:MAG TPA: FAD:protein FMN transferase [Opitutaceae bacterium]|nr:FAD:protein FMN transferase [Opitutaceae bacterium]
MNPAMFDHEAMATTFQVRASGRPAAYLRQAAAAAFRELDRLESELSRFVESSDISRANRIAAGEGIVIGEDAMLCLLAAARISALTQRAFDPAYRSLRSAGLPPDAPLFALDPAAHRLTSLVPRLHLDLGAVGKGYALDRMAAVLREWDITAACLQSGGSTVLALAPPADETGWPVRAGDKIRRLRTGAVSGSGRAVQGEHIVDPRRSTTADRTGRVWSFAESAADADALSTAFFVMNDAEVAEFCRRHPACGAILTLPDGRFSLLGSVPGD